MDRRSSIKTLDRKLENLNKRLDKKFNHLWVFVVGRVVFNGPIDVSNSEWDRCRVQSKHWSCNTGWRRFSRIRRTCGMRKRKLEGWVSNGKTRGKRVMLRTPFLMS